MSTAAGGQSGVIIAVDSPLRDDVSALLDEHLLDMFATTPAESVHALGHATLAAPGITFVTARDENGLLLGCGALRHHSAQLAELKSMRTASAARGRGVATMVLLHLVALARAGGYERLNLETGNEPYFEPARRLYAKHGFTETGPFADYTEDPLSVFMTLAL